MVCRRVDTSAEATVSLWVSRRRLVRPFERFISVCHPLIIFGGDEKRPLGPCVSHSERHEAQLFGEGAEVRGGFQMISLARRSGRPTSKSNMLGSIGVKPQDRTNKGGTSVRSLGYANSALSLAEHSRPRYWTKVLYAELKPAVPVNMVPAEAAARR